MATSKPIETSMSYETYIQNEQKSNVRHELIDGVLVAMTGGTAKHNRITRRLLMSLQSHLSERYGVYEHNTNVRISDAKADTGFYPDVVVVCPDMADDEIYTSKATLIIEVLSESNTHSQMKMKKRYYARVEGIKYYVEIDSTRRQVDLYVKQGEFLADTDEITDVLRLDDLDYEISLEEIYQ